LGDIALARGDFAVARRNYGESLSLASNIQAAIGIAASRASSADLAIAEGNPSDAEALARQAAAEFQQERLVDQEVDARNVLARSLLAQGRIGDAQSEIDRAMSLSAQDRTVRLSLAITAARLKARSGKLADAKKDLDACMADAVKIKLVGTQFDIAMAQAEVLATTDPKSAIARLQTLYSEAKTEGYLRVAADADRARQQLVGKISHAGVNAINSRK
jgi:tetratricopeptide (TPR) repeat protein